MSYKNFEKIDAKKSYEELFEKYKKWIDANDAEFVYSLDVNLESKYSLLRKAVLEKVKAYNVHDIINNKKSKSKYKFDVMIGLILYEVLDITEREAAINMYWEFLQLKILPDIIMLRWDIEKNENRFYKRDKDTRIYFKSVWWYVHMLLNKKISISDAQSILYGDGLDTDAIVAIVERTGKYGYDFDVNNELIKAISATEFTGIDRPARRIMYINSAKTQSIVPEFSEGGVENYAQSIVNQLRKNSK